MQASAKVMYSIAAYLFVSLIVYTLGVNFIDSNGYLMGPEWVGIVSLLLAFLLAMMLGGYFHLTANKADLLPEDWEEAETEDAAGIYGFFAPSSIWPFAMTMSIAVLGLGVIYLYYWLIVLGAILLVWSTTMLSLQYGLPKEKH
ncbi:MAG: cytochrome c oxidase subunit 4 [Corynebacterium sp.]|nr:cytochrome c oxidase subunit 4 [Corynebacterium sp.]